VRLEGIRFKAFLDSKGILTIGVGCTQYPDGSKVKDGDTCTLQEAKNWLIDHLQKNVFPLLKDYETVPDNVYVALCSFVYNVGHLGSSIKEALANKNLHELAHAFMLYVYADGKFIQGLKDRREIEVRYFGEKV
jgi:lysozyme